MTSEAIVFSAILLLFAVWLRSRARIRYWLELLQERGFKSTVHYDRCLTVFRRLYADVDGGVTSLKERKEKALLQDAAYVYGEVLFFSFVNILEKARPKTGEVFYDLGSGAGKPVMIAALVFDFSKVCGVEKLAGLSQLSNSLAHQLQDLPERKELLAHKKINVQIIHDDFLAVDFSDADIVFISALCFRGALFDALTKKLAALKVGARIILGSADLDNMGGFQLTYDNLHLMSWGLSRIRIYQRI